MPKAEEADVSSVKQVFSDGVEKYFINWQSNFYSKMKIKGIYTKNIKCGFD